MRSEDKHMIENQKEKEVEKREKGEKEEILQKERSDGARDCEEPMEILIGSEKEEGKGKMRRKRRGRGGGEGRGGRMGSRIEDKSQ